MIVPLAWALFVSLLTGHLTMCLVYPGYRPFRSHLTLKHCLALGLGLGVSSCTFFLWLLIGGPSQNGLILSELVFFACVMGALLYCIRGRARAISTDIVSEPQPRLMNHWILRALWISMTIALTTAVTRFFFLSLETPHGEIDALVLWNLRARFLYGGDEHWMESLRVLLSQGHSDYPLLIPATVARLWKYADSQTAIVPALVSMLFTFSIIGLALSSLSLLRTKSQGFIATLVLLGTPFLIKHGASQYADVPLAFYMLATLVLFSLHDTWEKNNAGLLIGAGMMAGFAGWTKNEGLLFLAAVVLSRLAVVAPLHGWVACRRELYQFAKGLVPILAVVIYYKTQISPGNNYFLPQGLSAIADKLTDSTRYLEAGKAFAVRFLRLGHPGMTLLVFYLILLGMKREERGAPDVAVRFSVLAIAITLGGYYLEHIVDPHDVRYVVETTLDRLWLQLWPSAVFTFFLFAKTPEEATALGSRASGER